MNTAVSFLFPFENEVASVCWYYISGCYRAFGELLPEEDRVQKRCAWEAEQRPPALRAETTTSLGCMWLSAPRAWHSWGRAVAKWFLKKGKNDGKSFGSSGNQICGNSSCYPGWKCFLECSASVYTQPTPAVWLGWREDPLRDRQATFPPRQPDSPFK